MFCLGELFYVWLRRMCVPLWLGALCVSKVHWTTMLFKSPTSLVIFYLVDIPFTEKAGHWNILLVCYYLPLLILSVFDSNIGCPALRCIYINISFPFLNWLFHHCITHLSLVTIFLFKVSWLQYKYKHPCSILVAIYMQYLFPSLNCLPIFSYLK